MPPRIPAIAVLVPPLRPDPGDPAAQPVGRAALALEAEGVPVLFAARAAGGRVDGVRATASGWVAARGLRVAAAYDRFPGERHPAAHAALLAGLGEVPVVNAPAVVALCRDKLATQVALEAHGLRVPAVEPDPARFAARLAAWGAGFLKPRYGALGRDIRRVVPGDALPDTLEGSQPGTREPALLQRAVPPPAGWAGASVRALVQRDGDGFVAVTPVLRRSRTDPVVNVARGAEVGPIDAADVAALAVAAAEAVAAAAPGPVVELGVDLVLDPDGQPWLVEVNGKPRGRLEALVAQDARWGPAHLEACARPLRWLARRYAR
ncbi:MAG: ATP-grasp domain-containing protein [Myxococcota bacterium]